MDILIFFGPPGSGKGTQAQKLAAAKGWPVISTGALFRREIEAKSDLGRRVEGILAAGRLVDDDIVNEAVGLALSDPGLKEGFILDGYPRRRPQQEFLLRRLKERLASSDRVLAVLVDVPEEAVVERLGGRRSCSCGETYHLVTNPPRRSGICDKCGRRLAVRKDDQEDVIRERLRVYRAEAEPMLDYWRQAGKLITVNGDRPIKEVEDGLRAALAARGFVFPPVA